jgi:hypothetical protein
MNVHPAIRTAVLLLLVFVLPACGSSGQERKSADTGREADAPMAGSGGGAAASCVLAVTYDGHTYVAIGVEVAPVEGKLLLGATIPPCNDTGDLSEPEELEEVTLAELPGVSPVVAVLLHGRDDVVLVRDDVDHDALPPGIRQLLRSPRCHAGDEPIELEGPWLGIVTPDEATEDDLVPPYDLEMSVDRSSAQRYERARLTIRVPSDLGRPLTRNDLRASLWEGGTISLTVACDGRDYVASRVAAYPPG